jgi:hypothetical protein
VIRIHDSAGKQQSIVVILIRGFQTYIDGDFFTPVGVVPTFNLPIFRGDNVCLCACFFQRFSGLEQFDLFDAIGRQYGDAFVFQLIAPFELCVLPESYGRSRTIGFRREVGVSGASKPTSDATPVNQVQYQDDDEEKTQAAARVITPSTAVWPSGERPEKQEKQNDDQHQTQHGSDPS